MVEWKVEANRRQGSADPLPNLRAWNGEVLTSKRHVITYPGKHHLRIGVLQHKTDTPARLGGALTVQQQLPCFVTLLVPPEDSGESMGKGTLARATGPEQ